MDEIAEKALNLLREVKSVAFATMNDREPAVRIIDVMLVDDDGLYFCTARGKHFYPQLKDTWKVGVCGMDKNYVSVRIVGDIRICDDRRVLDNIFEQNPIMNNLYPGKTREILDPFHLYRAKGEIFDLSDEPPVRKRFAFGGELVNPAGYHITEKCSACGLCLDACPVGVISEGEPYVIDGGHCLECGNCAEACPEDAIEPAPGL